MIVMLHACARARVVRGTRRNFASRRKIKPNNMRGVLNGMRCEMRTEMGFIPEPVCVCVCE